MIPSANGLLLQDLTAAEPVLPARTFRLNGGSRVRNPTVHGFIDQKEALAQTIYQILNTERYQWLIFSWNYGVEYRQLIGKDPVYCLPVIEKSTAEALLQDDRIRSVDSFSFEISGRKVHGTFTAHTIYGDMESELEVEI